jgi:glycosyltransferase involved in cell wall biosynthesis
MRVLIVHNRYREVAPSGENAVVDQESSALAAAGHEVELLQRRSDEIAEWSPWRLATLPAQVLWSEESRRLTDRALREFRPDVVHLHNTFPLLTPSVLHACRERSVPVVATLHNYRLSCANGSFFRDGRVCHDCRDGSTTSAVRHGCYRGSTLATVPVVLASRMHATAWRTLVSAYVYISAAQRDLLAPFGLPVDRGFVKHNFVPEPPPVSDVQALPQVAYVGRLDEAKGAPFLMRAWDEFRTRRPQSTLRLVIAGGGELTDVVARWSASHPSVTLAGHVTRTEVSRILAASRAALVPSQWEETFGMVAVEAMAVGTPAVAPAHGAFPELVTGGVDGALFRPTDVGGLVDVLADVDDVPARWARYGKQAQQTYWNRFTVEASVVRLLEVYNFALTNPVRSNRPTSNATVVP